MTTARDIISRSLRLLGVYSIGEEPTADEAQDALMALNSMLDSWANENLLIFADSLDVIPLIANQGVFTIGPTGSIVTPRPVTINSTSYIVFQNVSYPLQKLTQAEYNQITLKNSIPGIPTGFFALQTMPNVEVLIWPQPSQAMTLNLWSNKQLQGFPTLNTVLAMPPGAERAITFSLAEEIAPEYEITPSATIVNKAIYARKLLKRTNTQVPMMNMPYGIPQGGWSGWYNW